MPDTLLPPRPLLLLPSKQQVPMMPLLVFYFLLELRCNGLTSTLCLSVAVLYSWFELFGYIIKKLLYTWKLFWLEDDVGTGLREVPFFSAFQTHFHSHVCFRASLQLPSHEGWNHAKLVGHSAQRTKLFTQNAAHIEIKTVNMKRHWTNCVFCLGAIVVSLFKVVWTWADGARMTKSCEDNIRGTKMFTRSRAYKPHQRGKGVVWRIWREAEIERAAQKPKAEPWAKAGET